MRVLCICGSPRKHGNSGTIAGAFIGGMQRAGAETEVFELYGMKYSPCTACMQCKGMSGACIVKDDASRLMDMIRGADVLVIASPVYAADVSAEMKAFIERTHSFLGPNNGPLPGETRLVPGKRLVFILAQGCPAEKQEDIYPRYKRAFMGYGFDKFHLIRACDVIDPEDVVRKRPEIIKQAQRLAEEVCVK